MTSVPDGVLYRAPEPTPAFLDLCQAVSDRFPACPSWPRIEKLAADLGLSAPALVGLARALGISCRLFKAIENMNTNPVVHTPQELAVLFTLTLRNAQDKEDLLLAAGLLNTNIHTLCTARQLLGLPETVAVSSTSAQNSRRPSYVWEQKMLVKVFYSQCRTVGHKHRLARRVGIDSTAKLYNLASRLRATGGRRDNDYHEPARETVRALLAGVATPEQLNDAPVELLDLSTRAYGLLKVNWINSIGELLGVGRQKLLGFTEANERDLREIEHALARFGLSLPE